MAQSAKVSALPADNKDLKFLLSAIAACDSFAPAWETVGKENSILYGKNASKKFRAFVQKYGYKFEGGKLTLVKTDEKVENSRAAPKAPKKAMKPEITSVTPKKRKIEDQAASKDEGEKIGDRNENGDGNDK